MKFYKSSDIIRLLLFHFLVIASYGNYSEYIATIYAGTMLDAYSKLSYRGGALTEKKGFSLYLVSLYTTMFA